VSCEGVARPRPAHALAALLLRPTAAIKPLRLLCSRSLDHSCWGSHWRCRLLRACAFAAQCECPLLPLFAAARGRRVLRLARTTFLSTWS
jgi:hypothetical protein